MAKGEPKYHVGQVVMLTMGKERPFKILDMYQNDDGWYYFWNRRNAVAEHLLRPLTAEEVNDGREIELRD